LTAVQLRQSGDLQNPAFADTHSGGSRLNAGVHTTGQPAPRAKRASAVAHPPLALSAALFAAIVVLRFSAHTSQRSAVLLLLLAPIIIVSLTYRPRAGVAVATAAFAAYLMSQFVFAGGLDALASTTRAFTFYAIPLTIWLAHKDVERRAREAPVPQGPGESTTKALTTRELEILGLVAAGHTSAQIAEMLVLSVRTVESHRASMRRKLGRPSQAELVHHAVSRGVLPSNYAAAPTDVVAPADRTVPSPVY
jgi:DNA-binding CsgD family transcriptional regulator